MFNKDCREYLARLISFGNPRAAEEDADALAKKFDDLNYLLHVDEFALARAGEVDKNTSSYIRLVSALCSRRITDKFKNGKKYSQNEIKEYIIGLFFGLTVETVYIILFDENGKLISAEHLGDGTVNASGFLPRKLLEVVLRKGAKSVIIAHNHPCGRTVPSRNDIIATTIAENVLADANVEFLHHYIVAGFDIDDCLNDTFETIAGEDDYLNVSVNRGKKRKS